MPGEITERHGYHMKCYRRFTALPSSSRKELPEKDNLEKKGKVVTRSSNVLPSASSTGVFQQVCIFCNKKDKKHKGVKQKLTQASTDCFEKNIKDYARLLEDHEMLLKIQNEDFVSKEVHYHPICRVTYQNRVEDRKSKSGVAQEKQPETLWHIARETHQKAFEAVCVYVEDVILNNNEILLTNDVTNEYRMLLAEIGKTRLDEVIYNTQKLEQKLLQQFQDRIVIIKGKTRRGNIIFSNLMSAEEALRKEHSTKTKLMVKLRDTAFLLREEIMATENKKLPENLKIKDIFAGECKVPEILQQFLKYVICGPDPRRNNSIIKNRRIESICQDVIFATTSGLN